MIQASDDWYPINHFDWILHIAKINISGIGECELQTFPYQDDTNPPTVFIVADWGIVCGLRLDEPSFWGRDYKFTDEQKKEINDFVNSIDEERVKQGWSPLNMWFKIKRFWKMQNDRLEKIDLPEDPPDYTKLP